MARTSKPKSASTETVVAPTQTPVIEVPQEVPAVKKEKKEKKTKVVKEEVKEEIKEPVVPAVEENVIVETEAPIAEQSIDFLTKLQLLSNMVSGLKTQFRVLEKKYVKDVKLAQKHNMKRKNKSGNRAPSGFVKPTRISDDLAVFLGKDKGVEMARTTVTREINAYIRSNNLQDKENGRKIIPDAKLATLLKIPKTEVLTYFNLQRYMSPHFAKNVKLPVAESAVASGVEIVV
jgi:upstream activation factor subunit UAF30